MKPDARRLRFDPGRAFAVRLIDGPPSSGRWAFEPDGAGARVRFEADFQAPRLFAPIARRVLARSFRGYHANLRRHLEAPAPDR